MRVNAIAEENLGKRLVAIVGAGIGLSMGLACCLLLDGGDIRLPLLVGAGLATFGFISGASAGWIRSLFALEARAH